MDRGPVHVRVQLDSGEVVEALVLEWLHYPEQALVQLPGRQRASAVALDPVSSLYKAPWRPQVHPRTVLLLAGALTAGIVLGLVIPPFRVAVPTPALPTPQAVAPTQPVPIEPTAPAVLPPVTVSPPPVVASLPPVLPKTAPAGRSAPPRPSQRVASAPVPAAARAATRKPAPATSHTPGRPLSATRFVPVLAALAAYRTDEWADFSPDTEPTTARTRKLAAYRGETIYSCIRYPKCKVTSSRISVIVQHYEDDRDTGARCWVEAGRFGNRYAVVVRPRDEKLAADPDRRRVIRVPAPAPVADPFRPRVDGDESATWHDPRSLARANVPPAS